MTNLDVCLQKKYQHKKDNKELVVLASEENFSISGSPLLPNSHPIANDLYVCTTLSCSSSIERTYYSNKCLALPLVCAHCGSKECKVPQNLCEKVKV